jgi:hypothetical protein
MQASQKEFSIKWWQFSRTYPKCKNLVRKIALLLKSKSKCGGKKN